MTRLPITILAVLCASAAACATDNSAQVVDLAPSALSFELRITDADPAPQDGKVPVVVEYFRGNELVQLASTSMVTCNGEALPWTGSGYAARLPMVAAGGTFTFVHTRAGVSSQVVLTVPPRPVVTSPNPASSVVRSSGLAISYVASNSTAVRASASDGVLAISGPEQSDTGSAGLDVGRLRAGPGTFQLDRRVLSVPTGTGFGSVVANYVIGSGDIAVTWQ